MISRCFESILRCGPSPATRGGAPGRQWQRTAAAVVSALGLLATGCVSAGDRGAQPAADSPDRGTSDVSLAAGAVREAVIPPPDVAAQVLAAARQAAPQSTLSLQDCADWVSDPAISLEPGPRQECAAMLASAVDACGELDCFAASAGANPGIAQEASLAEAPPRAAPTPEGGHPPLPEAGMLPRLESHWDYPICTGSPPWSSSCYPPSEWEVTQDLAGCFTPVPGAGAGGICASRRPDGPPHQEVPRPTRDVEGFMSWCGASWHPLSCGFVLFQMKWSLDYLGAHPWCVLQQYYDRIAAHDDVWSRGARLPADMRSRHGWHLCPTVIDPGLPDDPRRRLSQTGVSLAEQCRAVLPADVQLEDRPRRVDIEPRRFGSDCDAWAGWVESRPTARNWRDCDRSARLAEEWMEHHHGTPEQYAVVTC